MNAYAVALTIAIYVGLVLAFLLVMALVGWISSAIALNRAKADALRATSDEPTPMRRPRPLN